MCTPESFWVLSAPWVLILTKHETKAVLKSQGCQRMTPRRCLRWEFVLQVWNWPSSSSLSSPCAIILKPTLFTRTSQLGSISHLLILVQPATLLRHPANLTWNLALLSKPKHLQPEQAPMPKGKILLLHSASTTTCFLPSPPSEKMCWIIVHTLSFNVNKLI